MEGEGEGFVVISLPPPPSASYMSLIQLKNKVELVECMRTCMLVCLYLRKTIAALVS